MRRLNCVSEICHLRLAYVAKAQAIDVKEHMLKKNSHDDKPYERELKRSSELLRNLQRLKVSLKIGQVTLGDLPLQLGYADAKQWMAIQDSCRTAPKSATLHNFLQKSCECGLMHWKVRELDGVRITQEIGSAEWAPVLIHMMKEQVMHLYENQFEK